MYKITYNRQAAKSLSKMPKKVSAAFFAAFDRIVAGNEKGLDIVSYKGLDNGFRLRIGAYRAIYTKSNKALIVDVVRVARRGGIYK